MSRAFPNRMASAYLQILLAVIYHQQQQQFPFGFIPLLEEEEENKIVGTILYNPPPAANRATYKKNFKCWDPYVLAPNFWRRRRRRRKKRKKKTRTSNGQRIVEKKAFGSFLVTTIFQLCWGWKIESEKKEINKNLKKKWAQTGRINKRTKNIWVGLCCCFSVTQPYID